MKYHRTTRMRITRGIALLLVVSLNLYAPLGAFAQENVDATGSPTGATGCTGAECTRGITNGWNSGVTTVEATNENTGTDSTNENEVTADTSTTNAVDNTSTTTTNAAVGANSGENTGNKNTGGSAVTTGNANVGVTQVVNDNSTAIGGTAGLNVTGYNGDYNGDLNLDFGSNTANLSNTTGTGSVRATNDTTGQNSTNSTQVTTKTEAINEIQNDGTIDNVLELEAITGKNEASMNTGDGQVTTGDANIAATLVNLLNTTVINGDLWVTVTDIFGDLNGNINIPELAAWLAAYQGLTVDASNANTGSDSTNTVNVDVTDAATTQIINDAVIDTLVTANAITGQNESLGNTGGAQVTTGDATVAASNVTLANTTIDGGNWGLFVVNALNGWLGFMVGDNGQVQALSQDETLQHIQAQNSNTGADSENTVDVDITREQTDTITNVASISNEILANAITGQNDTNFNTGAGIIDTGDANITATTVNVANTTVKNGSLFIAVVNIFGDWFGDLLYGGQSLATQAAVNAGAGVGVNAANNTTGEDSTNEVNVNYDRDRQTTIENDADISTTLNANVDTGGNHASKNTGGAQINTGDGLLAMHTRTAANLVGLAGDGGLGINLDGLNTTTGENSKNKIQANINDNHVVTVNNDANVSTVLGSVNNPALVNTGNNSADMNTLGAMITTGNASAAVAIENLVNQVMLALAGRGITVDANFANELTGALSTNTGELTVTQRTILDIVNRGLVENLINLLLNTGGNTTNQNTGEVAISTGAGCLEANITTDLNRTSGHKGVGGALTAAVAGANTSTGYDSQNLNTVTTDQSGQVSLDNDGTITNDANIDLATGNNEQNMNTGGAADGSKNQAECPKIALAPSPSPSVPSPTPTPSPTPPPADDDDENGDGQGGGGDQGPDQAVGGGDAGPRIAGVTKEKQPTIAPAKGLLKRFPVAGGEAYAQLFQGKQRLPWQLFVVVSMMILGAAWSFDRKAHTKHLGQLP